jgi:hypothetical protein
MTTKPVSVPKQLVLEFLRYVDTAPEDTDIQPHYFAAPDNQRKDCLQFIWDQGLVTGIALPSNGNDARILAIQHVKLTAKGQGFLVCP